MISIKKIFVDLLNGIDTNFKLDLKFHNVNIEIVSNSANLIKELSRYYSNFCVSSGTPDINIVVIEEDCLFPGIKFIKNIPDPPKQKIKEEYCDAPDGRIVRKILTGMVFIFSTDLNLAVGKCLKNSNQVINFINNRYIEFMLRKNCLLFHAAAVSGNSGGAVICGCAGAGKSTLALNLLEYGLYFLSNDRVLAKKLNKDTVKIYGVPKLPRVNPGTIITSDVLIKILPKDEQKLFKKLNKEDLWELEHKYDIYIDSIFGSGKFIMETKMKWLFILNWKRNGDIMQIDRINLQERQDLFPTFIKSPGLFYTPEKDKIKIDMSGERYLELLKNIDIFEITGEVDFKKASNYILKIMSY